MQIMISIIINQTIEQSNNTLHVKQELYCRDLWLGYSPLDS